MIQFFKQAKFTIESVDPVKWQTIPVQRSKLAREFQDCSEEDLLVSEFTIILRPI